MGMKFSMKLKVVEQRIYDLQELSEGEKDFIIENLGTATYYPRTRGYEVMVHQEQILYLLGFHPNRRKLLRRMLKAIPGGFDVATFEITDVEEVG